MKLRDPVSFPVSTPFIFELRLVSIISLIFFCWLFVQSNKWEQWNVDRSPAHDPFHSACSIHERQRESWGDVGRKELLPPDIRCVPLKCKRYPPVTGFFALTVRVQTYSVVIDNFHSNWNWLPQNISIKLSPGTDNDRTSNQFPIGWVEWLRRIIFNRKTWYISNSNWKWIDRDPSFWWVAR